MNPEHLPSHDEVVARVQAMIHFLTLHPELQAELPVSVDRLRDGLIALEKARAREQSLQNALRKSEAKCSTTAAELEAAISHYLASGGDPTDPNIQEAIRYLEARRRKR